MPNRPSRPQIHPSVLAADFLHLGDDLARMVSAGADGFHLDVMDGHFVDNISFGPDIVRAVRSVTSLPLTSHLMVTEPGHRIERYVEASRGGECTIIIHVEAPDDLLATLKRIRALGAKAGLSLNPGTPVEALDPYLAHIDTLLFMTVYPGFGGQRFREDVFEIMQREIPRLSASRPDLYISVDGGVNGSNGPRLLDTGCDELVAGSYLFGHADPAAAIRALRDGVVMTSTPSHETASLAY